MGAGKTEERPLQLKPALLKAVGLRELLGEGQRPGAELSLFEQAFLDQEGVWAGRGAGRSGGRGRIAALPSLGVGLARRVGAPLAALVLSPIGTLSAGLLLGGLITVLVLLFRRLVTVLILPFRGLVTILGLALILPLATLAALSLALSRGR